MDHQIASSADRPLGHATPYSLPPFLSSLSPINLKPMTAILTLTLLVVVNFSKKLKLTPVCWLVS